MSRDTTPPPDSAKPEGSTSDVTSHTLTEKERYLHQVFSDFDVTTFDWTAFEGTYKGRALIVRLMHVGHLVRLPPPTQVGPPPRPLLNLMRTALERAKAHIKAETWDVQTYAHVGTTLDTIAQLEKGKSTVTQSTDMEVDGLDSSIDVGWIETTKENEKKEYARLDVELRGYLSNLIKESIRLTYLAFAQLAVKTGSHANVMKNYSHVRLNSSSPQHHVDLGLGVLEACLAFNMPNVLPGYLSKLDIALDRLYPTTDEKKGPTDMSQTAGDVREGRERQLRGMQIKRSVGIKLHVARGLIDLGAGKFDSAGRHFAEVLEDGGLQDWEGSAISTADVCLLAAMCILSSGDRDRIRRIILERSSFRAGLDDTQGWISDLTRAFVSANYQVVSRVLAKVEPSLQLNPFLAPHVREIYDLISERAVVQYVEPFATVKISKMASSFGKSEVGMIRTLERLIKLRKINGKIDLINKVLSTKEADPRGVMISNAIKTGKRANSSTQLALLQMRLREAGVIVDPRPKNARDEGDTDIQVLGDTMAGTAQTVYE